MDRHSGYIAFPEGFVRSLDGILGSDSTHLLSALDSEAVVSIRLNTDKAFPSWLKQEADIVPWNENGHYLDYRPVFTTDPLFHAGSYYVQEPASMCVNHIIRQVNTAQEPLRILDLCAAPGGKSSLLSQLGGENLVISNEIIPARNRILRENLLKWGHLNRAVTMLDVSSFRALKGFFDIILVDAPCSGEGMFRKDPAARNEWSEELVDLCAARQKRILSGTEALLKEGGLLVYSTCTFNTRENEDIIKWFTREFDYASMPLSFPADWGIAESPDPVLNGYRFYPHRLRSEGLFVSVLQKLNPAGIYTKRKSKKHGGGIQTLSQSSEKILEMMINHDRELMYMENRDGSVYAIGQAHFEAVEVLAEHLPAVRMGTKLGQFKRKDFIPSHALAMSGALNLKVNTTELGLPDALRFLKKEAFDDNGMPPSWNLVTFEGQALGWVKKLPNRINNYYPKEFRILMNLDYDAY